VRWLGGIGLMVVCVGIALLIAGTTLTGWAFVIGGLAFLALMVVLGP
jgi:hypothetical protein